MVNNHTQIDSYLQNEMSVAERKAFESRLATDTELKKEFDLQQQVVSAINTAGIKNEFGKAIKKRILTRQLIRWGIVVAIAAAAFLFYGIKNDWFSSRATNAEAGVVIPEKFEINNAADTIIETKDGVVFAIPANAFHSSSNTIQLEIKTALDAYSIIQNGLSTMSNTDMLQTAGMFSINGFENGQPIPLQKEIVVSVPARDVNPAMQLFDGVQDTNGHVNWVNPRPVEKKLRTYDITSLDFYPPDYIPTLQALRRNYRDKRYTDSLYYSFGGYPYAGETISADIVINETDAGAEGNDEGVGNADDYSDVPKRDTAKKAPKDTLGHDNILKSDSLVRPYYYNELHFETDPARIKAIWNKKFNNTILATKEFEERLRYIHTLCNAEYLDAYIQGLNRPLHETDQLCADNSSGDIKNKFLEFAARNDGKVIIAEGIQEKLTAYFQQKFNVYQEAAIKTREKYAGELQRLNNIADQKQQEEAVKDFFRDNNNFTEEFCINLTESYEQIGVKRSCYDTLPATQYYNFNISTTGWKNLDVYVFESTRYRQSMTYTDPQTGKTAKLTYAEVTMQIEDQQQYDKVLVYLIPDSLSSFQRVQQQEDMFKEKLNSLFHYDAIALAYKGTKTYYYRQQSLQPGAYTFSLSPISQEELRTALKTYSPGRKTALQNEFAYQLFGQQEIIRQVQVRKDQEFREQVAAAIFKCGQGKPITPVNDTILPAK